MSMNHQSKPFSIVPFITLGLLDTHELLALMDYFTARGITTIEFGFPFSDSVADGPIIQQANQLALENGFVCQNGFTQIAKIKQEFPTMNIALLLYANLVFAYGLDSFYKAASTAGVSMVLIPDVPNLEAMPYINSAKKHNIQPVLFATLNCSDSDLEFVSKNSEGFVYVISRAGVTGLDKNAQFEQMQPLVQKLYTYKSAPPICGFGIKSQLDIAKAQQCGCQGAIVGSAFMAPLVSAIKQKSNALEAIQDTFEEIACKV